MVSNTIGDSFMYENDVNKLDRVYIFEKNRLSIKEYIIGKNCRLNYIRGDIDLEYNGRSIAVLFQDGNCSASLPWIWDYDKDRLLKRAKKELSELLNKIKNKEFEIK